jgi:hypothetical protein
MQNGCNCESFGTIIKKPEKIFFKEEDILEVIANGEMQDLPDKGEYEYLNLKTIERAYGKLGIVTVLVNRRSSGIIYQLGNRKTDWIIYGSLLGYGK